MVLMRCTGCHLRPQSKYNQFYLAWFTADGRRIARKIWLCDECAQERLAKYIAPLDPAERLTCPSCGIDTEDDYEAVYGKAYIPGCEPENMEMPFCSSCRNMFVAWAEARGESLEDRRRVDIDPSTHPSGLEVLRSMGIQSRVR